MKKEEVYIALSEWAQVVKKELGVEKCFIFGSLIHRNGEQFDSDASDIDLVIEIPLNIDSEIERVDWLENLKKLKQTLEQQLFVLLQRSDPNDPIVSVLPVTKEELFFDIHKSGAKDFFSGNTFKCLYSSVTFNGIEGSKEKEIENNFIRQVIQFCQKNRNEFLSNTIHGDLKLLEWQADGDVLPKALMRYSAMISEDAITAPSEDYKFDLQVGLDHLYSCVYLRRHEHAKFKELHNWLSVKRAARGDKTKVDSLPQCSHLFLSEVLFGLASSLKETSIVRHELSYQEHKKEPEILDIEGEPAELIISGEGNIPFSDEELTNFVERAIVNMKWDLKPYFLIGIPELTVISNRLSESSLKESTGKSERTQLFDRYSLLKRIKDELDKGIKLLLWNKNYLIKDDINREECLNLSIRQYCKLCYELSLIRASRYGGLFECYNPAAYSEFGSFCFSIPQSDQEHFFAENKIDGIMHLAAENRFVDELKSEIYALYFIPLLVKHGVDKVLNDELDENILDQGVFFNVSAWKFGIK